MKLPSPVPESKSMECLVVLADPASGTAKAGSLMFFEGEGNPYLETHK